MRDYKDYVSPIDDEPEESQLAEIMATVVGALLHTLFHVSFGAMVVLVLLLLGFFPVPDYGLCYGG